MASIPVELAATPEPRGLRHPIPREEWWKFASWLAVWVILANIVFAGMWLAGAPARGTVIIVAGAVGSLARDASLWIRAADFPATDFVIVGDHMPPYFDRHHRSQFAPDRVPWQLLKWKEDPAQQPAGAADLAKTGDRHFGVDG